MDDSYILLCAMMGAALATMVGLVLHRAQYLFLALITWMGGIIYVMYMVSLMQET